MRGEWWASLLVTGVWMITGVGMWAVLWYGTRQVASGQITPGGLFAFFLYVLQTLEPLRRLSEVQALLQRALASAARVYEITDCTAIERGGTAAPHSSRGSIRFEAVHFRYRPDEPVLQGLTLTVQPGEPVALVAASGGGRSTLAKLLVRFADPQSGSILLDGIDIRMLTTGALRRSICVVEQEPFLFSGPLLDNLRYGSWGASRRCVEEAVAMVGL
jgi:ABC-type multidrug transport system fused ATPase/permease subunit